MDKIKYDQTEGFPLDVNILDFGQKANQISQQLGEIVAPLAIIKGCVENGNNVSDGLVYIDGELLPFKGGLKQNNVRIVETSEPRVFENGNSKEVLITRYATFGIGATVNYNWSDFHRPKTIKELESLKAEKTALEQLSQNVINLTNTLSERLAKLEILARPLIAGGSMMFWNKSAAEIPSGWREAENWRERMPMGWNPDKILFSGVGNTGGTLEQSVNINSTGWGVGTAIGGGNKPAGQLVVTNNQREIGESFESIANATGSQQGKISTLSPYRIVIFIEPIL